MENTESNSYYLEKAPIKQAISHLSIPMMIGISAGTVYNIINAYFIGLVHDTAMLSAITLSLPTFTILMAFGNMFGVGGGTFITRLVAQGEAGKAKKVAGYSFYGCLLAGLVLAVIACFTMKPLIQLLGTDAVTFEYTRQYSLTLLTGGFAIIGNFGLEQLVRAEGASKESMYGMFVSIALSIVLDILFILVLNWHVFGAALSLVLANIGSSVYYIRYLETRSEALKGFLRHFKMDAKAQLEVYQIGVSELIQTSFLIASTLLLNNYSMMYGNSVAASFGIALRIVQLPEFLSMGLFLGIIPLLAYNFSNKNIDRLKAGINQTARYIAAVSGFFVGFVYLFKSQVIHFFSNDPSVLAIGADILAAMLISALFNGFTGLFTGLFQASGEGISTTVMAAAQGVLFIPVIVVLQHFFGLQGVIWSMTAAEGFTFVIGTVLFIIYTKKLKEVAKEKPYFETVSIKKMLK
jgi:multidrug efflux pump